MTEIVLPAEIIEIPEPDVEHLITEDDTPVDNIFSEKQQRLLTESLYTSWEGPPGEGRSFIALANVGLFYAVEQPAVVPDVLVSLDVQLPEELWAKKHRSYFMWEYGKPPEVVVEIVSNQKGEELGRKRALYTRLRIAYYVVFDPGQQLGEEMLYLYELRRTAYVAMSERWLPELGLGLTLWSGEYEGKEDTWLRWCDQAGNLILTGAEAIQREREQTERERERAERERERAERLATQLRALGIEPEA
jgi:Uma2 family endonuclease